MSIPPLVCSSPPPPEQCEDDKEPEDYDFQYNSQPDDDEDSTNYNYDNLSSNTIYKTETKSIQDLNICENLNVEIEDITPSSPTSGPKTNSPAPPLSDDSERNSDLQDDCVLEDLNLELTTESLQINTDEKNIENPHLNEEDSGVLNIQDAGGTEVDDDNIQIKSMSQESSENDELNNLDNLSEDISFNDYYGKKLDEILPNDNKKEIENVNEEIKATASQIVDNELNTVDDDDFGDFDSFQCSNPDTMTQSKSIMTVENPWEGNIEDQSFGDFTANFDEIEPISTEMAEKIVTGQNERKDIAENLDCDDEDDFGDFDDFKSSEKADITYATEDVLPHASVLDFPTSDNEAQIMENINKVLATIFTEEISEPSETTEATIDQSLGEIWGHLVDTDVRLPYMVNWNNTLGQKSLLKALCIDSRNILFGSRWNYNMPKFAANLSASPLQPQKPVQSNPENSEQPVEKDSNTWVDPFTPHGQEYTYAEALLLDLEHLMATLDQMAHKHSTLKISDLLSHACSPESEPPAADAKSSALDGFGGELPTGGKIYSSTISAQPLRQISLPDTHIFTPTDSETPRSKTIHYDNTRNLGAFDADVVSQKLETTHITTSAKDEYWDFQHFKGDASSNVANEPISAPETVKEAGEKTFGTQILQPIKMEPVMPTLNWPNPGEVKETFMDFSDFMSSASVGSNSQDLKSSNSSMAPVQSIDKVKEDEPSADNDDDFETFQSAPPSNHSNFENIPQNSSSRISNLDNIPTQLENRLLNPSTVSSKPNEIPSSIDAVFKSDASKKGFSSHILAPFPAQVSSLPVLQPSPVNRNQASSGQILQPLSLEGFSQINWPNPGIDWHDLSKFNPIESVHSLKSDSSTSSQSKLSTPVHARGEPDDDWGDFVSSAPQPATPRAATPKKATPKRVATFNDDDEWTDFVSSTSATPPNGLNTISLNVQTSLDLQKANQIKYPNKNSQINLDIPTLNYITPKTASRGMYAEKHFQNL